MKTPSPQSVYVKSVITPKFFGDVKNWLSFRQDAVYTLTHRPTGKVYIGKSSIPLNRIYKHLVGNASSSFGYINSTNWHEFDVNIIPVENAKRAAELERHMIKESNNCFNIIGKEIVQRIPVQLDGVIYPTVLAAAKALNVYPVKLYKAVIRKNSQNFEQFV